MEQPIYNKIKQEYYETHEQIECPVSVIKYRAYKNGKCTVFDTREEASRHSNLIEWFSDESAEYKQQLKLYQEQDLDIRSIWHDKVREYFSNLSDGEYKIIYNFAYARDHSDGYDAVFHSMQDLYDMVIDILKLHGR